MREAVPDIVIGGAPRSGTTYLAASLARHPCIFLAQPLVPEPKVCLAAHPLGDEGHRAAYRGFFAAADDGAVRVEKTTNYLESDEACERLARLLPAARFLFILREPVARAVSNWKWSTRNGLERLPFHEAVALEGQRPNPLGPGREAARPFDYMLRGRYGSFARAWYDRLGRERVHFMLFETALREPDRTARQLERWIGLAPLSLPALTAPRINATEDDGFTLDAELATRLRTTISPEVEAFHRLTGIDVTPWGYA